MATSKLRASFDPSAPIPFELSAKAYRLLSGKKLVPVASNVIETSLDRAEVMSIPVLGFVGTSI